MKSQPISQEVGAALARFFFGGAGPSHAKLTRAFMAGGYGDDDLGAPKPGTASGPNKEHRLLHVFAVAVRRPANSKALIQALLTDLRVHGSFTADHDKYFPEAVRSAQAAFTRVGWNLSDDGQLFPMGEIDLSTGGRQALEEQLERLRKNTDDPAALLGTAKDLLEASAKFVLEGVGFPVSGKEDFNQLWYLSRERLNLLPQNVDTNVPGYKSIQAVLGSAWKIADQVNALRNLQGTGHGRTLPTGVTGELALLVVREACSVADFMLSTLDRQLGKHVE
ncbi:abortive infection family protein [Paenarthrobacter sp. NPDC057355]|uniref:abortive infection family protein n=1 Tax=Paenarthrobacter sp. NPDC057355 TaxID=3346105 RepID=UPI0036321BFF